MSYDGPERRSIVRCPLHDGMVDWIKEEREQRKEDRKEVNFKLDKLIDNQVFHHDEIIHIKSIVSDGLQTLVKEIAEKVEFINKRVVILDEFRWFGEWINGLRNHVFKNFLRIGLVGGMIFAAIYFGNKIVSIILK